MRELAASYCAHKGGHQACLQCASRPERSTVGLVTLSGNQLFLTLVTGIPRTAQVNASRSSSLVNPLFGYLALLTAQATTHLPNRTPGQSWHKAHEQILQGFATVDFKSVLHYAWNCGIAVLPLCDSGAFHGAVWRIDGRNVILLKQKKQYPAVWLYDLLHEIYHAGESPNDREFGVIESAPISMERRDSDDEEKANDFAEDVILGNRSDEIEEACVAIAGHTLGGLKTAIVRVAERYGVDQGALANYMAFYLQQENGVNYWGTANNLQEKSFSVYDYTREVFFQYVDLNRLNEEDREILIRGLREGEPDA